MLAYVYDDIELDREVNVSAESFDDVLNLFAGVLSKGVARLLKRGLHRDYERLLERLVPEKPYDQYDQYDQGIPVARRMNKHLFTWLLSFYLGIFGADRFFRGQPVLGLAKLMTFGGFGFWYLADLVIAVMKSYGEGYRDMDDLLFDRYGRYIY